MNQSTVSIVRQRCQPPHHVFDIVRTDRPLRCLCGSVVLSAHITTTGDLKGVRIGFDLDAVRHQVYGTSPDSSETSTETNLAALRNETAWCTDRLELAPSCVCCNDVQHITCQLIAGHTSSHVAITSDNRLGRSGVVVWQNKTPG